MTNDEKLNKLKRGILPDTDTDEVLMDTLESAGALILNRMYPFGYPDGTVVPSRYERIQIQLAAELYSKRGAEGQTSHSENGISRSYESADVPESLLGAVTPMIGVI